MNEQHQLINTEGPNPFEVDESEVDSANPKILTVEADEDGDIDVEIDI